MALVLLGLRSVRPRYRSVRAMMLVPLVTVGLAFWGALGRPLPWLAVGTWIACVALGAVAGWPIGGTGEVTLHPRTDRYLMVPGSLLPLAAILLIFADRYGSAVLLARHTVRAADPLFIAVSVAIASLASGVLLGRRLRLLARWRAAAK